MVHVSSQQTNVQVPVRTDSWQDMCSMLYTLTYKQLVY